MAAWFVNPWDELSPIGANDSDSNGFNWVTSTGMDGTFPEAAVNVVDASDIEDTIDGLLNAAFDAGSADAVDAAADADVVCRLQGLGICGASAITLIASSRAELVSIASEVLGYDYTEVAWAALCRVWAASSFPGQREIVDLSRRLLPSSVIPPVNGGINLVGDDTGINQSQGSVGKDGITSIRAPSTGAASDALAATTRVFLAATSTPKRQRDRPCPLPPIVPGLSGHADLEKKWEKVLGLCRDALNSFGADSPRYLHLHARGTPAASHLAIQDDVFRNNLANPATVRGYQRDLEGLHQ